METNVILRLEQEKIVAVLRRLPLAKIEAIGEALVKGGIRALEVTMDGDDGKKQIERLRYALGNEVFIGAGTVFTTERLIDAIRAGAAFIVCPHLDDELIRQADEAGVTIVPGIMTPSELQQARKLGVSMVKIFPASTVGTTFVQNILGPFAGFPIMATGGIDENNVLSFFQAGVSVVGAGSFLTPKQEIEGKDYAAITRRAENLVKKVR
jgi:2-dehydro-3-deoxyphosphogluconate aldolase/(4S)-4-hydroxy-2-oxoglutarate aldolase